MLLLNMLLDFGFHVFSSKLSALYGDLAFIVTGKMKCDIAMYFGFL